jgi:anti-anti-sigma factor
MLSLTIHNLGEVTVFRCVGRITAEDRDALRNTVLTQPHIRIAVLDLAEISAVDAAGLGTLVSLRRWAKTSGTKLKLMNLMPSVEEVLDLTKLRSAFEVCSVQDMLDLLCRATSQARFAARDTMLLTHVRA